jgi:hypothetical protein
LRASESHGVLLSDQVADGLVSTLRIDSNAANDEPYFYSFADGWPLPTSVDVDPSATHISVRAVVRHTGACEAVSLEVDVGRPGADGKSNRAIAVTVALGDAGAVLEEVQPTYALRLRDVEERVEELKHEVRRARGRDVFLARSVHEEKRR